MLKGRCTNLPGGLASSPVPDVDIDLTELQLDGSSEGESCGNVERVDIVLVQKTQDLKLTPPTHEGPNLSMAKNVITLNGHCDSADSFRRRILSLPTRPRGISQSKFHSFNHSRSKSMSKELNREDIDAKDYIEEDGVKSVKVDVIN